MGIFADAQPKYAACGIATFPVSGKKPLVSHYHKFGINGSTQLALKFADADGVAFMAGNRSKVTVVDMDHPDEHLLKEMLRLFGKTPMIVRSGSGSFQLWYAYGGETRRIRPNADLPVDILGQGVVIAPPSRGSKGIYTFVRGSLADLGDLRPANQPDRICLWQPRTAGKTALIGR